MAFPPDATLADVGEFGLIAALTADFEQGEHVLVGPGDDAAVLRVRTGHVVVSTDLMVEGRHFRRDWASAADVGHRAAAQNLSDINAMGGRATSLTIGLAAPPDLPAAVGARLRPRLRRRVRARRRQRGRGRRSTRADQVVIAVTVARRLHAGAGGPLRCRARATWSPSPGARAGPPVGSRCSARGFRSPRVLVEAYRRPEPPYDAGVVAAEAGATAMIDVSDGLRRRRRALAEDSGVAIDIHAGGLRDRRAAAGGRGRAGRRPAPVHPRRRRRPRPAGDLPRRRLRARGLDRGRRGLRGGRASPSTARRTTAPRAGRTSDAGSAWPAPRAGRAAGGHAEGPRELDELRGPS